MLPQCTALRFATLRFVTLVFCAGCLLEAGEPGLKREGAYWVEMRTGPLARTGALKIRMRGPVVIRGGAAAPSYILKTRVRAKSEGEARRLLTQLRFRTSAAGGTTSLALDHPDRPAAAAELEILALSTSPIWLETFSGDVEVYDMKAGVVVSTGAGLIQMDRIGGDVEARTAGGEVNLGQISGSVHCFSGGGKIQVLRTGGESWFETAGGDVELGDISGNVHVSTAGGNIRLGRSGGGVTARSAGGRIEIQEAGGAVVAGNSGGSIQVGPAKGVRLEATGGSIRLRGSSGALRAVSDVGSIFAELIPGVRLLDSALSTGAGDITVFIPSNIALTIKALNENHRAGRIVSDFPEILVRQGQQESRMQAEGTLNGGGPVLQLTSTGGTIYLRRLRH